jgi:hypothetical protein
VPYVKRSNRVLACIANHAIDCLLPLGGFFRRAGANRASSKSG